MKTILHKADTRGHVNFGWLDSRHTFSFGHYHNPERMHFGALRVINDDIIAGGSGFGKHPHDNMEIVSIPIYGGLQHSDTTGKTEIIKQNDVQIMSAGSGLQHSEMNASETENTNFLQIWVFPKKRNIDPRYEQKTFLPEERINKLQTVVAPDDANALWINQDAWFSLGNFSEGFETTYNLHKKENGVYVFVIEGSATIGDQELNKRDGLGIWDVDVLDIKTNTDARLLFMEIPMEFV
jgi:redox-sensitive bicupin YhaK (pirin superfamily)